MIQKPKNLAPANISENAELVLSKRYYRKDSDGNCIETASDLFWRVASAIAEEEKKYAKSNYQPEELAEKFYSVMTNGYFLPNSPTLMNAGSPLGQLSACFVLPVGDSIEEIFDAIKYAAMIHKSGGGTGFSFSNIRSKDSRVGTTGGVASGPVSFLRIFNTATEQIKQGGTRRGANMGILRVDHPDIMEFIRAKEQEGEFVNFNLSVALTEKFMEAVEKGEDYNLIDPHSGAAKGTLNAKEVFDILVNKAWVSGDPGIVFLDRINRDNPTPQQGEMQSTNPCGEQPLLPYEACNLGSINLSKFVIPNKISDNKEESVDWERLKEIIHISVRFLDNVIDASKFPLEKIAEKVRTNRKIGLGVMGFADMLFALELPYNSEEALQLAEKIMEFIQTEGHNASRQLAEERGAFPAFSESIYKDGKPLRNATVTTIAPTGTLSIIAGCSSGVEPIFALAFARHVMDGERLVEVNPYFENALKSCDLYTNELMDAVTNVGSIASFDFLPQHIRDIFVTAMDISAEAHLRMQAAFQKYTDNAVSKTVNLPNNATIQDIDRIYRLAYTLGCKGVTVYRDGCKSGQVLNIGSKKEEKQNQNPQTVSIVRQRPDIVDGFTQKVKTGLGVLYLTVNEIDGQPFEVFTTIGKSGRSITAKAEAIGRLVSLCFRSGVPVRDVVQQLKGIGGEHPVFQKKGILLSIPDAIAWVLENRYLKGETPVPATKDQDLQNPSCPECGSEMTFQEGCHICQNCGYSRCG